MGHMPGFVLIICLTHGFAAELCPFSAGDPDAVADDELSLLQTSRRQASLMKSELDQLALHSLGGAVDTAALLETVKSIASSSASGGDVPLDATILDAIISQITDVVINATRVAHAQDVVQVGLALDSIQACNVTMQADILAVNTLGGTVREVEWNHTQCRRVESYFLSSMTVACGQRDSYLEGLSLPACADSTFPASAASDVVRRCLVDVHDWSSRSLQNYDQFVGSCATWTSNHTDQESECKRDQSRFEFDFCELRSELDRTCHEFDTCRNSSIAHFNAVASSVQASADARILEFRAAKRIICYLQVLKSSDPEKDLKFKYCKDEFQVEDDELDELVISLPPIPGEAPCDSSPIERGDMEIYPGHDDWLSTVYGQLLFELDNLAWIASDVDCNAMPSLTR